jgi:SAM-dependent methyltransferase
MTTAPLEPHQAREAAESFGADAARYDRSRPSYPDAMIEAIVTDAPGRDVLDIGIGTGIVARQLRAAGCTVLGVEADARMADFARGDGFAVEVAKIEDWEPQGRIFDVVVSGQAWHWVDPVAGSAKVAQVLRPGGRLAVFWNVMQPPAELEKAFGEVNRRVLPDSPLSRRGAGSGPAIYAAMADKAADGIRQTGAFGEVRQRRYEWDQGYTRDQWLEMSSTTGITNRLPQDVLAELLAGFGAAIDAVGGSFVCHYTTVVLTARG